MASRLVHLATTGAAALVLAVGATTASAAPAVSLGVPSPSLAAGQEITATLANHGAVALRPAVCTTLQRRVGEHWHNVTHSHGVSVACPRRNPLAAGPALRPGATRRLSVPLYDDLIPGAYRLLVPYRLLTADGATAPLPPGSSPQASVVFSLRAFRPGPAPRLSPSRLLAIARRAAGADGDAHPRLIQAAEGSHALADVLAGGDLPDAWNWTYLVALRGDFTPHFPRLPGIPMGPGPVVQTEHVLTLVLDARTGAVSDVGLSNRYPDLARLGPALTLAG